MQPVGPESEHTYWVRRVVVIGVIVVLVAVLAVVLVKMMGGSKKTADPAASASVAAPTASSPDALPSGISSATPTPSAKPSTSASATPSSSASVASSTSASARPSASPSASKQPSASPSATHPSASATQTPRPSTATPVACRPSDLHLGIDSAAVVTSGKTLTLKGTILPARDCTLQWAGAGYEMRIYSGTDRIWSTNDCSGRRPSGSIALKKGRPQPINYNWPTQRSIQGANCQMSDEYLRPGTYVVTMVLKDVAPVQRVFRLVG